MSRLDSAKKYLIDDKSGDAPSDDYLAYTNGSVDGGDPTERSAKRRKLLIGVAVAVAALVVLIGIICYAVLYGNKSEEDKKQPSLPIWDAPRLNASIVPFAYSIGLRVDLHALTFNGSTSINVTNRGSAVADLVLHSMNLTIDAVVVTLTDNSTLPVSHSLYGQSDNGTQYLYLQALDQQRFPTGNFTIHVVFHAPLLLTSSNGLYATNYTTPDGSVRRVAATQFEPTHARRAFPCFDEMQMKAVFTVAMEVQQGLVALSNAPNVSTTAIGGGWQRVQFAPTAVRQSSYLMAFAVSDFVSLQATQSGNPYPFKHWGRKDLLPTQGQEYCDRGFAVQDWFARALQQPFPLPKQDQMAVPNKGGAMENYGLVMYRTNSMYLDNDTTSTIYQGSINVHAHELAHQWWGDLFTPTWWSDTWTKEGSATFWSYVGMQAIMGDVGDWQSDAQATVAYMEVALRADALDDTEALVHDANYPAEVAQRFRGPTYNKGGSLLRMIRGMLGEANFFTAVRDFLSTYAGSTALSINLFNTFEKQAPAAGLTSKNLTDVFWMWASQAGFPLISVAPSSNPIAGKRTWTLTQSQYSNSTYQFPTTQRWPVWVQYVYQSASGTSNSSVSSVWLDSSNGHQPEVVVDEPVRYLKFNFNRTGFYRVLYPLAVYAEFQTELATYPLSLWTHQDRIGLLMDTYQLQVDGRLGSWEVALNATLFLQREHAYSVWAAGAYVLQQVYALYRHQALQDPVVDFKLLTNYVQRLTANVTSTLPWVQINNTQHLLGMLQQAVAPLACRAGNSLCMQQGQVLFDAWVRTGAMPPANLRPIAFGYNGYGQQGAELLLSAYRSTPNPDYAALFMVGAIVTYDTSLVDGLGDLLNQAQRNASFLRPGDTFATALRLVVQHADRGWGAALAWLNATDNWQATAAALDVDGQQGPQGQLLSILDSLIGPITLQVQLDAVTGVLRQPMTQRTSVVQARYAELVERVQERVTRVAPDMQAIRSWMSAGFV